MHRLLQLPVRLAVQLVRSDEAAAVGLRGAQQYHVRWNALVFTQLHDGTDGDLFRIYLLDAFVSQYLILLRIGLPVTQIALVVIATLLEQRHEEHQRQRPEVRDRRFYRQIRNQLRETDEQVEEVHEDPAKIVRAKHGRPT
ncbi:Phospholipid-transporting ATPase, putative [Babesia ovata]|uniref:Phospholipid-transporting ATPase, putative n=1 Tax=Babesia ovata TaxID=189622 RepID=A0A2H6KDU3_9APIC|nr:Phospholipid-transporting ATPase, putative [Babesia ovata]GBE61161.1 Phospholipid-transporting ATPase, putative [Babesia ovata]